MKHLNKLIALRVSEAWNQRLLGLLGFVVPQGKGDRSRVIRELVERESMLWLDSPYISLGTEVFFLITADRNVFYHQRDHIRLHRPRLRLPAAVAMKNEKVEEFLDREDDDLNAVRARWIVNHFSASEVEDGPPIAQYVDRRGGVCKNADLLVDRPQDSTLWRETIGGIREYVQFLAAGQYGEDRGGVAVKIPTLDLTIRVIVDLAIYSEKERARQTAAVDYEFRNGDAARWTNKHPHTHDHPIAWLGGRFPEALYTSSEVDAAHTATLGALSRFRARLDQILESGDDDGPFVGDARDRQALEAVVEPSAYLFGTLRWHLPPVGMEVCATWNRPAIDEPG
ncbi:MAG: hypothetical protein AAGE94_14125 [Acidobacteriota bacterium]